MVHVLLGFEGFHTNKSGGSQREGSATFFRKSRYTLVTYKVLTLSEIVAELLQSNDPEHIHRQLRPILASSESLRDHARQVTHFQRPQRSLSSICIHGW